MQDFTLTCGGGVCHLCPAPPISITLQAETWMSSSVWSLGKRFCGRSLRRRRARWQRRGRGRMLRSTALWCSGTRRRICASWRPGEPRLLSGEGDTYLSSSVPNPKFPASRVLRVQKEEEEAERLKLEAVMKLEQQQQEFIKLKEKQVLQLQVWGSQTPSGRG